MYKNIEKQIKLQLKDLVAYQEGQVVSKTLVQNDTVSMTIFSFDKGEEISTHAAGGDAMVTVLEGKGRFTVADEVFYLEAGETPWDAVINSVVLRFLPIMLTAAAAILGMLPLMTSTFWGPMAVAIASGLLAATILTLLVLPVMYAAAYGISR